MKAVITVIGKDTVGIIAKVATLCAEYSANIEDITQSVLKDSNNALKPEYSSDATYQNDDGIHLTATAYSVILQYIRTHAYTPVA